jgi:hypothetical protein
MNKGHACKRFEKTMASALSAALLLSAMPPAQLWAAAVRAEGVSVQAVNAAGAGFEVPTTGLSIQSVGTLSIPSAAGIQNPAGASIGAESAGIAAQIQTPAGVQAASITGQTGQKASIKGGGLKTEVSSVGAAASEKVGAISSDETVAAITQTASSGAKGDMGAGYSASSRIFDNAGKSGSIDLSVAGKGGATAVQRLGRRSLGAKAAAAAAAAVTLAPAAALAQDAGQHDSSSNGGLAVIAIAMGAIGIGGIVSTVRSVRRVAASLDKTPTAEEIASYKDAEDTILLHRASNSEYFAGERIFPAGSGYAAREEIRKKTGKDPYVAVQEAFAVQRDIAARYPAYVHPTIAGIVRYFKGGKGGGGSENGGGDSGSGDKTTIVASAGNDGPISSAAEIPQEVEQKYKDLRRQSAGIDRLFMMGRRDMILPADYASDLLDRRAAIKNQLAALEAQHPGLVKPLSAAAKAGIIATVTGIAGGLIAGVASATLSAGAASTVIAVMIALAVAGAVIGLNIFIYPRMSPEGKKKYAETVKNIGLYK